MLVSPWARESSTFHHHAHLWRVARSGDNSSVATHPKLVSTPDFIPMPRLSAHEVKIAELERVVGKQTM